METNAQTMPRPWMLSASGMGNKQLFVGFVFLASLVFAGYSVIFLKPLFGFGVLLASGLFLLSFLNMDIVLAPFVLCILFSPEIDLNMGTMGSYQSMMVRLEDFLAIVFGLSWIARLAILREYKLFRSTPLNRPILFFVLACSFSTVYGISIGVVNLTTGAIFLLKYIQYFLVFMLTVNYVTTYAQVKKLLWVALIVVLCLCTYNYWQIPSVEIWSSHRISAPFAKVADSTGIGAILVLAMAMMLGGMLYASDKKQKFWFSMGVLFVLFPILYTLSRTTYAAFVFMVLVIAIFSKNKTLWFVCILLLFLAPIILPQEVIDRITYVWRDAREYGVDTSTQERIFVYKKAWNTISGSLLTFFFGYGVSAFDILDSQYARTAIETGVVGLFLFLLIFYTVYKTVLKIFRNTRNPIMKGVSLGYIAGLLGLLVHGIGAITFTMIRPMEMFWFLTGIMFVYASIMDKVEANMPPLESLNSNGFAPAVSR